MFTSLIYLGYISATEHWIFKVSVDIPIIRDDRVMNFEDPMVRSRDIAEANVKSGHFY